MKKSYIWKLIFYLIIYSFFGYILETLYALVTEGVWESRQSFIYGPFCIIYGIAGTILIFSLEKYKSKNVKLFIYGLFLGSFIEYMSSLIGEIFLHAIWWDYSNSFLNISGRTCLYFAIIWGILSVLLINYINPAINKFYYFIIKKINFKKTKAILILLAIFFIFDSGVSCLALENFLISISNNYEIKINGIKQKEENVFLSKHFSNERMILIYPNIIVLNEKKNPIYLESVLDNVKNYYYKFGKADK